MQDFFYLFCSKLQHCISVHISIYPGACPDGLWSKALPLTAGCFSPLPWIESRPGHVRVLPVTWGQAVVFAGCSGFLHQLQLASHD